MRMKTLTVLALVSLVFVSIETIAQNKETRNVTSFSELAFGVPGTLHLKQGATESVVLEGDPDILEKIETEVKGNRLVIKAQDRWYRWNWGNNKITAYVTMKTIRALNVGGSGNLIGEGRFSADDLDLRVSGSGNIDVEADARGQIEADVSGSGNISLKGKCDNIDSDVSGSGKVRLGVAVSDQASFGVSGSGKIEASGSANRVKISISGSGGLRGANFETKVCDIHIAGSGDVEIGVIDELDANISGSGSVAYRGNPNKVHSHSSGSGKVRKL
jgi:Putative auto-transporter adhesin, head GIN domain